MRDKKCLVPFPAKRLHSTKYFLHFSFILNNKYSG